MLLHKPTLNIGFAQMFALSQHRFSPILILTVFQHPVIWAVAVAKAHLNIAKPHKTVFFAQSSLQ